LVEGNFDVVSLHAHGQTNVLAPLGTAFTPEQATQLKRLTPELILLFDGDAAGRRAVRAAREVCQRAGLVAKVASLPDGIDPDELVRTQGLAGLERTLRAARPLLEYLIDGVLDASFKKDDARGQAARIKEVTDLLASEDDPTVRLLAERHADSLASMLGVSDAKTFEGLRSALRRAVRPAETGPNLPPASRARSRDQRSEIGLQILGVFLDFPELAAESGDEVAELLEGESAAAYAALRQGWAADLGRDPEDLLAKLPATIHAFARARFAAPKHQRLEDARIELSGNVRQLKALGHSRETKAVAEELGRGTRDFQQEARILEALFQKARQRKVLASD
jgi:DNA primase